MPTVITKTLKKDGSGDYTTIKAFVVDNIQDLVAADIVLRLEIHGDGWGYNSPLIEQFIDFNGYTTDATRRIELYVVDDDRHTFKAETGFTMGNVVGQWGFVGRSQHVLFSGFSMPNWASGWHSHENFIAEYLLYNGYGDGHGINFTAYHSMSWDNPYTASAAFNDVAVNCTVIMKEGTGAYGGDIAYGSTLCTNCLVYKEEPKETHPAYYAPTIGSDYNGVNRTGEGLDNQPNSLTTLTKDDFVDYDNNDFRLKADSPFATAGQGGTFMGAAVAGGTEPPVEITLTTTDVSMLVQSDSVELIRYANLTANDVTIGINTDVTELTRYADLTTTDLTVGVNTDLASIITATLLTANDVTIGVNTDLSELTRYADLTTTNVSLGVSADLASIITATLLTTTDVTIGVNTDVTELTRYADLTTTDLTVGVNTDLSELTRYANLTTTDVSVNTYVDLALVTSDIMLTVNDVTLGVSLDSVNSIRYVGLGATDVNINANVDGVDLTRYTDLTVDDVSVKLGVDLVTVISSYLPAFSLDDVRLVNVTAKYKLKNETAKYRIRK